MENKKIISINVAEYAVGNHECMIETSGIGSCLVICLYDENSKIGGMAHSMLAHRGIQNEADIFEAEEDRKKAKYVDEAIDRMIFNIERLGGDRDSLKAKLVGGAEMFNLLALRKRRSLGEENILSAKKKLAECGIPIVSEDTGGSIGRSASFNLDSGILTVSVKM